MNRFFSLPIAIGIIAGLAFPYESLSLIWASSILLFLLLFFNVLEARSAALLESLAKDIKGSALAVGLLFIFFPVVQTAIASALLRDHDMVFGVAMSSLAPVALVVPLFLRKNNGDIAFGVLMVVASTLLCPLVLLPLLGLMGMTQSYLDARSLMLYLFPFTIAPVVIGLLVSKFLPRAKKLLSPLTPYVSSTLLGLIMFILVGSAFNRAPIRSWLSGNLVVLTLLMVWMDFGVYWLIRWAWNESAAITIACRNFAVPASLLLFFHPKAALPSAVGLVVHAFFFQWLMSKKAAPRSISN